jgi:hypothetical protein
VRCLIPVAAGPVGNPAERSEIGHPHRERLAGARHLRREIRRGFDSPDKLGNEILLSCAIKISGEEIASRHDFKTIATGQAVVVSDHWHRGLLTASTLGI